MKKRSHGFLVSNRDAPETLDFRAKAFDEIARAARARCRN
jgi:hypothetical protein